MIRKSGNLPEKLKVEASVKSFPSMFRYGMPVRVFTPPGTCDKDLCMVKRQGEKLRWQAGCYNLIVSSAMNGAFLVFRMTAGLHRSGSPHQNAEELFKEKSL